MLFCATTMARPCRGPPLPHGIVFVNNNNKISVWLRVPRFERHRSSRGKLLFADDAFHFQTRSRRPRQNTSGSLQNIQHFVRVEWVLMNYKQMPINYGHPFGFYPTRRGLIKPPPRRNNQTNKEQEIPLARMHVTTGRIRGQPTCRRPMATTGRGA